jgi:hypothetical protein
MQSPPKEWLLFGAHFVALDYLRSLGDADHDTLSEVVRNTVAAHPRGRLLFAAALAVGGIVLHEHIVRPLRH